MERACRPRDRDGLLPLVNQGRAAASGSSLNGNGRRLDWEQHERCGPGRTALPHEPASKLLRCKQRKWARLHPDVGLVTEVSALSDQVLGAPSKQYLHDPLIGDLAFEQVSSGISLGVGHTTDQAARIFVVRHASHDQEQSRRA